mmetsp:Transcript_68871/g.165315  ORF Transcript_68871/g.165315 Transcript_68871/m.165315 type:complete len:201 (+) Transcript_68871:920-1522(+)
MGPRCDAVGPSCCAARLPLGWLASDLLMACLEEQLPLALTTPPSGWSFALFCLLGVFSACLALSTHCSNLSRCCCEKSSPRTLRRTSGGSDCSSLNNWASVHLLFCNATPGFSLCRCATCMATLSCDAPMKSQRLHLKQLPKSGCLRKRHRPTLLAALHTFAWLPHVGRLQSALAHSCRGTVVCVSGSELTDCIPAVSLS